MKMKKKISFSFGKGILLAFMWIISLAMFAQQITVKGTVKDTKGEPLIGVTVRVEGTTIGTITDMDGVFTLSNVPADATLEFSYVGMKTQRIPVNGRTSIDVVMEEEAEMLEEVVVVGFGTQKKVNLTGAVSTASSREIESRPVVNVTQALQGLVPGLNISSSNGSLEAKPSVNIRGVTTIGEGSTGDPLILIDGMEGDLNSINPQDIESISVLKDAAASSIYGSRAPFGVILVTTKKGDPGKITVNYNNNFRWGSPVLKPDMMDSYTFATYFNDASINAGWSPHFSSEHLQRIKDYQEGKITYSIIPDPNNPQYWADGYAYGNDNVDWYDAIYKSSTYGQEHNFSASGGISEKTTFYTSFNYLDQNGLMKLSKDFYDRYTVSGKINSELTNWLRFGYNFRFSRENYQRPAAMTDALYWDLARQGWPTLPLYDPNGYLYSSPSPALGLATGGKDKTMTDNTYHQGFLIFEPIKNWITHVDLNYRITTAERHWDSQRTYNHDVNGNPYVYKSSSNVHEDYFNDNYFNINAYTEYSFSLNETHNLKLMAGFQAENLDRTVFGVQRDGIIVPELPEIDLTTGLDYNGNPITPSVNGSRDSWSTAGYFGRFNYDYENKYLAEINLRYDGTSRFREDQRWNLFPSFSLGWNMAQENFWETLLPTINLLKFRVSYGELGNQNTSNWYPTYQIMPVHSNEGSWLQNGTRPNTAYVPALVSSTMGWEKVENWNGGIDFGLLRNRLTGSFDYYIRRTKDMIGPAQELPAVLGIDVPKTNNTDLKTYGFDFELVWRDRLKNGLGYSAKLLLSDSQTEITKYPNPTNTLSKYLEGRKLGEIWGYETIGIAKTDSEMQEHLVSLPNGGQNALGSDWRAGDIMYRDLNDDGKIDDGANTLDDHGDLKVIGNNTPRYLFGIDLSADWKGFDFRAFFQGVLKRDYWQGSYYFWGVTENKWWSCGLVPHVDYFRDEVSNHLDVNLDSYYPRPIFGTGKNQQVQTRYLQNASYIRLKNLQLGYTLPSALTTKANLSKVRIFVSGENLWTGTKTSEMFDPETISGGAEGNGNAYPLSKIFSFGLSITL
jgi:TonB-linked SusC/RagA family outer membrane protein